MERRSNCSLGRLHPPHSPDPTPRDLVSTSPAAPALADMTPEQEAALKAARLRATGLLAVVAVGFVITLLVEDSTAMGYIRAALEASLVGGLADWFAVVALFRHPLGLPIPHTAVIAKSKDQLGDTLGEFARNNFLGDSQLRERLVKASHLTSLGTWLADDDNAGRIAGRVGKMAVELTSDADNARLRDEAVKLLRDRLRNLPAGELAGRGLQHALEEGRQQQVVSAAVDAIDARVTEHRDLLRLRFTKQAPSWVPDAVNDLIYERAEEVIHNLLHDVRRDETHEIRQVLTRELEGFSERLLNDPTTQVQAAKRWSQALDSDQVDEWLNVAVGGVIDETLAAAADPSSELQHRLRRFITDFGLRLQEDQDLRDAVVKWIDDRIPRLGDGIRAEVQRGIAETVDRWDGPSTSRRLEAWLGRDLQFVRINGTIVGGLVGLVLHVLSESLG